MRLGILFLVAIASGFCHVQQKPARRELNHIAVELKTESIHVGRMEADTINLERYQTKIFWHSSVLNSVVTAIEPVSGGELEMFQGSQGSYTIYGLRPGLTYIFRLWNNEGKERLLLQETKIVVPELPLLNLSAVP